VVELLFLPHFLRIFAKKKEMATIIINLEMVIEVEFFIKDGPVLIICYHNNSENFHYSQFNPEGITNAFEVIQDAIRKRKHYITIRLEEINND